MDHIAIHTDPLDIETAQRALRSGSGRVGAVVTFMGLMRELTDDLRLHCMTLEHYPGMTEKALTAIVEEARERWAVERVVLIHRVGVLQPQDPIVFVGVTSQHRAAAFSACEFLIDYLKTRAPFWKKEHTAEGAHWVASRTSDELAAARWEEPLDGA